MSNTFIDIHNHILPFMDDGAEDFQASLNMLKIAYDEGIRQIIATPHYYPHSFVAHKHDPQELLLQLARAADSIDHSFKIHLGQELFYHHDIIGLLRDKKVHTLAGSDYVLTEFMPQVDYTYIKNGLYELQSEGYLPVLAHIERYRCLLESPGRAESLYDMGIILQVNASSVLGENGAEAKKFVKMLLKQKLIHLVATDAHNYDNRAPAIKKCAGYLNKKMGQEYTKRLLYEFPLKIIENEYI